MVDPNQAAPQVEAPKVIDIKSDVKETGVHFKKEKIRDADGNVIGEGKKLPSLKVGIPIPNAEGILQILEAGGKELELLTAAAYDVVYGQLRSLVNEIRAKNPDAEIKPEQIDQAKLGWSFISLIPPAERRGLGIAEEDWEAYAADYRAIMPRVTGKDKDRIEKHVQLFKKKFGPCRNDKKALGVLKDMLNMWAANTSGMEENEEVYEYLTKRVDTLLAEEEKVLAEAL